MEESEITVDFDCREVIYGFTELDELVLRQLLLCRGLTQSQDSILACYVRLCDMREGISIEVSAADRERLAAVVADRNSPQKRVWWARIILATAEGCGTAEIMRRAEVSKPCVWRWQERFMREGCGWSLAREDPN